MDKKTIKKSNSLWDKFSRKEKNATHEEIFSGPNKQTRKHRKTAARDWSNLKKKSIIQILAPSYFYQNYNVNHRQETTQQTVERKILRRA